MSTSSSITFRSDYDSDYAVDARGSFEKISKQNRRPSYRRAGTAPSSVNGIHRRRQNRWTWGHGRGARLENLRAIARCVIAAVAALCAASATANPITLDMAVIGSPGNPSNPLAPSSVVGGGSVPYGFMMSKTEVTNAQYASFLNSVARVADPNGLWNASMAITRSGSAGNFSYAPSNPNNTNRPVAFVSFYDSFRFVNWLENGMPNTGSQTVSTTENGTYDMSLAQPTRQSGAQYWIPSVNEWYKAAFYDPARNGSGGYWLYPTSSDTLAATAPAGGPDSANFNGIVPAGSTAVGSYTSALSPYGLFDMAGNIAERTDTVSNSSYFAMQGNYSGGMTANMSTSNTTFVEAGLLTENARTGFRVAAVPEPSTIVLTGMGVVSLLVGWRRKQRILKPGRI